MMLNEDYKRKKKKKFYGKDMEEGNGTIGSAKGSNKEKMRKNEEKGVWRDMECEERSADVGF